MLCPLPGVVACYQMWHYVFFIIHLRRTPTTDLTGVELHILKLLESEDTRWFPLHKVRVPAQNSMRATFTRAPPLLSCAHVALLRVPCW